MINEIMEYCVVLIDGYCKILEIHFTFVHRYIYGVSLGRFLLVSWVRIPLEAGMFVFVFQCRVFLCR
jgi:hypothetical protein